LAADQITTKNKEKIDTDPAEAVHAARQFESEKRGVINNYYNDRKRTQQIEAGLAFAILKTRIDCGFGYGFVNGANIAEMSAADTTATTGGLTG
jgi:hypothetical protein